MEMRKRSKIVLACLSFLIGIFLSSVLLHFLFGDIIHSRYDHIGLLAPSNYFLHTGYVDMIERFLSYLIDALIFGGIIYFIVRVVVGFSENIARH